MRMRELYTFKRIRIIKPHTQFADKSITPCLKCGKAFHTRPLNQNLKCAGPGVRIQVVAQEVPCIIAAKNKRERSAVRFRNSRAQPLFPWGTGQGFELVSINPHGRSIQGDFPLGVRNEERTYKWKQHVAVHGQAIFGRCGGGLTVKKDLNHWFCWVVLARGTHTMGVFYGASSFTVLGVQG